MIQHTTSRSFGLSAVYNPLHQLIASGDHRKAIASIEMLLATKGPNIDLLRLLCKASSASGDANLAKEALAALKHYGADGIDDYLMVSRELSERNMLVAALGVLNELLEKWRGNAAGLLAKSSCLARLGRLNESIEVSRELLKAEPKNKQALWNLGLILHKVSRFDEALSCYERLVPLEPEFLKTEHFCNIASILRRQKKYSEAIDILNRAMAVHPTETKVHFQLASTFYAQDMWEQALHHYDCINDLSRTLPLTISCCYKLRDWSRVREKLRIAAEVYPRSVMLSAISAIAANQNGWADLHPFCPNPHLKIHKGRLESTVSNPRKFISKLKECLGKFKTTWEPNQKHLFNASSTGEILNAPFEEIEQLKLVITSELNAYREKFAEDDNLLITEWPSSFDLRAWHVKQGPGGYQETHIHANAWVSGVFYLETIKDPIENEGAIEFCLHGYDFPVLKDYPRQRYQPEPGDIITFPASLFHRTIPIVSKQTRRVVAFDLIPSGSDADQPIL